MTETQHEARVTGESITRLIPGEIFAILAFWAFLAVLTAAGRLVDPRVAAVAAMRAACVPRSPRASPSLHSSSTHSGRC